MVPESVKLAKDAFDTLKSSYGDEDHVMMLRVKELKKIGPKPDKYKDQVAWLTDLMGKLQGLVELGDQNGNFARDVFSTILKVKEHLKMAKAAETYGKCTKQRMEDILRRLEEMPTSWTRRKSRRRRIKVLGEVMGLFLDPEPI